MKPIHYICSVILTLLLIISLIGTTGALLCRQKALSSDFCNSLVEKKELPQKVAGNLSGFFKEQENTTGIPSECYESVLDESFLAGAISASIDNAFAYLNGETDTVGTNPDFTKLESDLTAFFSQYADENGYEKDAVYDETLAKAISNAEQNVKTTADVFRFASLADAGLMAKAKKVMPYLPKLLFACIAADIVLILLLMLTNRKALRRVIYWIGTALFAASLLMLVPCAWVQATHWFDRFTVKSDQIFAAVTGYLYGLTDAVIDLTIRGLVMAAICWIVFAIVNIRKAKKDTAKI